MLFSQLISFCHSFFNGSHHIEGLFWEMVIFTYMEKKKNPLVRSVKIHFLQYIQTSPLGATSQNAMNLLTKKSFLNKLPSQIQFTRHDTVWVRTNGPGHMTWTQILALYFGWISRRFILKFLSFKIPNL